MSVCELGFRGFEVSRLRVSFLFVGIVGLALVAVISTVLYQNKMIAGANIAELLTLVLSALAIGSLALIFAWVFGSRDSGKIDYDRLAEAVARGMRKYDEEKQEDERARGTP